MIATQSPAGSLCILNASFNPDGDAFEDHSKAHIPGSLFFDLGVVRDIQSPYPHTMPNQAHFVRMMKSLNIRKSQTVVIYENGKGWFATRTAFVLKAFGHPKVHLLEGNFPKWKSEGRAISTSSAEGEDWSTDFDYNLSDGAGKSSSILSYERIKEVSADASIQIVDCRPAGAVASGMIPGSINVPVPQLLS